MRPKAKSGGEAFREEMMKKKVVVAMSGGVDSSVAAALLKEQGYEVIGATMRFRLPKTSKACVSNALKDVRQAVKKLGIAHYSWDMQELLEERVIKDFCREYARGRTPNPCLRCNQYLKFGALLAKAHSLGAGFLATGHYARIVKRRHYLLKKAKDKQKDQSYFLYRLTQKQLGRILFPLGGYTKEEVRALAGKFKLLFAGRQESQEICFLAGSDYRGFLKKKKLSWQGLRPGLIVDQEGQVLGRHKGTAFYTIGQREGLGIAKGCPLYVTSIDSRRNKVVAGRREDAFKREFILEKTHFIVKPVKKKIAVRARIRYNHKEAKAWLTPFKNKFKVCFIRPQFAITPGQAAVFYKGEEVLGGGTIEKVL